MNDTLVTQNYDNSPEKISVPILLRGCSMRKLHNDFLSNSSLGFPDAYDKNGKSIISGTTLRVLLPPNVKKLTNKYKEKCEWKVCTLNKCHQNNLNEDQLSTIKRLEQDIIDKKWETAYRNIVYKNKTHLHSKPRDALHCIQYRNVDGFSVPCLKCILQKCEKCPKYIYTEEEGNIDESR